MAWHSALSSWNNLISVSMQRPTQERRVLLWLWCALAVLVGCTYSSIVVAGQLLAKTNPLGAPAGHQAVSPESTLVSLIPAVLATTTALWIAWRPRWVAVNLYNQQRGRIAASIGAVLGAIVFVSSIILPLLAGEYARPLYGLALVLLFTQVIWLVRHGQVALGGTLLMSIIVTVVLAINSVSQEVALQSNPVISSLAVIVSGLLVSWWCGLLVAATLPIAWVGVSLLTFGSASIMPSRTLPIAILLLVVGGIIALYTRTLEKALGVAEARGAALTDAQAVLSEQNTALQGQTDALHATQGRLHQTVADQERRIAEAVAELRLRSVELSSIQTPLIPVARGVLIVPLIGAWDEQRAEVFTQNLLHGVERQRTHTAVLDLTGLAAMSEGVARMVLRVVTATRLLGCRCVLVGVQPESAQALVGLGIDLLSIETSADLADGVARSLNGSVRA